MKFKDLLTEEVTSGDIATVPQKLDIDTVKRPQKCKKHNIDDCKICKKDLTESKSAEDLLRAGGMKIKLVTDTKFGKQVDFAKHYEQEDIEKLLKNYTLKFDDKSVFIID